jgi:hypothetical protein
MLLRRCCDEMEGDGVLYEKARESDVYRMIELK